MSKVYTPEQDAVGDATAYAAAVETGGREQIEERKATLLEEIRWNVARRKQMLGVERVAADALSVHTDGLSTELRELRLQSEAIAWGSENGYPALSRDVFTWRTGDGFPVLVPFSIDYAGVTIRWDQWGRMSIGPDGVRHVVGGRWENLVRPPSPGRAARTETTLRTEFKGVIPEGVRQTIARFPSSDVFLLAQVDTWSVQHVAVPQADPLVLVRRHGELWVVDKFDTTPIEEYVAEEFTS